MINDYEAEARSRWGNTDACREHEQKTKNYTKEKWAEANDGLMAIFAEFAACKDSGSDADSAEAQALVAKLQAHITEHYYTCTDEILAGLGKMYVADERFKKNIDKYGEGTAEFVAEAIEVYCKGDMSYQYITLREKSEIMQTAAEWFNSKWRVPTEAYLACMSDYLQGKTDMGWYLCLDGEKIIGGLGVIENDFHDRPDLTPNICAVYTEEAYRGQGIAGRLLNMAVEDLQEKGISPVYLLTDHMGLYERYGWEFFCMAQGDGEEKPSRMYVHR